MNENISEEGGSEEQLRPTIHHDLAKLGWRIPQTEGAVQAAEECLARSTSELPSHLSETPDLNKERLHDSSGILNRYLSGDEPYRMVDAKDKDDRDPDRDIDRG
jgi:hypothetical protein